MTPVSQAATYSGSRLRFESALSRSASLGVAFGLGVAITSMFLEGSVWNSMLFGLTFAIALAIFLPLWVVMAAPIAMWTSVARWRTVFAFSLLGVSFFPILGFLIQNLTFPDVPSAIAVLLTGSWISACLGLRLNEAS